jgi:AcrR family transcriptional regulator
MGRRILKNIDERILNEVLKENFKYGISCISTKRIASHLGISEPVIFTHFGTKDGLMTSAFTYAWGLFPHVVAFPKTLEPEDDRKAFAEYKSKIEVALDKPLAISYIEDFLCSRNADYKIVKNVTQSYRDDIIKCFKEINPRLTDEMLQVAAERFIESSVATIYHMVMGQHPHDDKTLMLYYTCRIYGMVAVLEMKKASKPADFEEIEFDNK